MDYQKQATNFLKKTKTNFSAVYVGHDIYFDGDKEARDIYTVTLTRYGKKPFVFKFGQSLADSGIKDGYRKTPTAYDVLSCLQKYDVGTFEDFCDEFGYDTDSRKAEKIYFAVQKEVSEVMRLFGDVLEDLREIQ